ncbi:MAG: hypothetical protein E2581_08910 [Pseudomonas sp.]|uniref:hypothetical protein n=1 Tax=Pseudomonas sp. TaxID=306 RepID=UPI001DE88D3E|nr:hypothetical protein [Pseudomonas sp.]MPS98606.1 hypothetical protein [Pseudomonas sp.]
MGAFADQLSAWGKQTEARMEAIYRRSVKLLADEMATTKPQGGRVPFETGNLARSLVASTQGMPKTSTTPTAGATVGVVIATLKLNQPIWLGYQAIYARRMNYGFVGADKLGRVFNQQGSYFVEGAIEKWPQIVAQAAKEIQGAVEGRQ